MAAQTVMTDTYFVERILKALPAFDAVHFSKTSKVFHSTFSLSSVQHALNVDLWQTLCEPLDSIARHDASKIHGRGYCDCRKPKDKDTKEKESKDDCHFTSKYFDGQISRGVHAYTLTVLNPHFFGFQNDARPAPLIAPFNVPYSFLDKPETISEGWANMFLTQPPTTRALIGGVSWKSGGKGMGNYLYETDRTIIKDSRGVKFGAVLSVIKSTWDEFITTRTPVQGSFGRGGNTETRYTVPLPTFNDMIWELALTATKDTGDDDGSIWLNLDQVVPIFVHPESIEGHWAAELRRMGPYEVQDVLPDFPDTEIDWYGTVNVPEDAG